MVKCTGCGLLYVNPQPDQEEIDLGARTGAHEGEVLLDTNYAPNVSHVDVYADVLNTIYGNDFFSRQALSWLDIGCGYGEFIRALTRLSSRDAVIHGLELNENKLRYCTSVGIRDVFGEEALVGAEYDFISLLNVYSHLPNPVESLQRWKQHLSKHGEVLIQTGDWRHLRREEFPRGLDLPDHLSFATEQIVTSILRRLGFRIVTVERRKLSAFRKRDLKFKVKDIVKLFVRRHHKLTNWYVNPWRDMWIRAKLY